MTQCRVGEQGAVVVDSDGRPVVRLRPGYVVDGDVTIDPPAVKPKRRRGYQDKAIRAERDYEDKSV